MKFGEWKLDVQSVLWQFVEGAEKKVHQLLKKLKKLPGLSDGERTLYAVSLASTPDERWQRMQRFLQLHSSSKPFKGRASAS